MKKTIFLQGLCLCLLGSISLLAQDEAALRPLKFQVEVEAENPVVTVSDYCKFLNTLAATDSNGLYNEKMDGIERSGAPRCYSFAVASGDEEKAVTYVSQRIIEHYNDWRENVASTSTLNFNCCEVAGSNFAACDEQLQSNRISFHAVNAATLVELNKKNSGKGPIGKFVKGAAVALGIMAGGEEMRTLETTIEGGRRAVPENARRPAPGVNETMTEDAMTEERSFIMTSISTMIERNQNNATDHYREADVLRAQAQQSWNERRASQLEKETHTEKLQAVRIHLAEEEETRAAKDTQKTTLGKFSKWMGRASLVLAHAPDVYAQTASTITSSISAAANYANHYRENAAVNASKKEAKKLDKKIGAAEKIFQDAQEVAPEFEEQAQQAEEQARNVEIENSLEIAKALKAPLNSPHLEDWTAWADRIVTASGLHRDWIARIAHYGMSDSAWAAKATTDVWMARMAASEQVTKQLEEREGIKIKALETEFATANERAKAARANANTTQEALNVATQGKTDAQTALKKFNEELSDLDRLQKTPQVLDDLFKNNQGKVAIQRKKKEISEAKAVLKNANDECDAIKQRIDANEPIAVQAEKEAMILLDRYMHEDAFALLELERAKVCTEADQAAWRVVWPREALALKLNDPGLEEIFAYAEEMKTEEAWLVASREAQGMEVLYDAVMKAVHSQPELAAELKNIQSQKEFWKERAATAEAKALFVNIENVKTSFSKIVQVFLNNPHATKATAVFEAAEKANVVTEYIVQAVENIPMRSKVEFNSALSTFGRVVRNVKSADKDNNKTKAELAQKAAATAAAAVTQAVGTPWEEETAAVAIVAQEAADFVQEAYTLQESAKLKKPNASSMSTAISASKSPTRKKNAALSAYMLANLKAQEKALAQEKEALRKKAERLEARENAMAVQRAAEVEIARGMIQELAQAREALNKEASKLALEKEQLEEEWKNKQDESKATGAALAEYQQAMEHIEVQEKEFAQRRDDIVRQEIEFASKARILQEETTKVDLQKNNLLREQESLTEREQLFAQEKRAWESERTTLLKESDQRIQQSEREKAEAFKAQKAAEEASKQLELEVKKQHDALHINAANQVAVAHQTVEALTTRLEAAEKKRVEAEKEAAEKHTALQEAHGKIEQAERDKAAMLEDHGQTEKRAEKAEADKKSLEEEVVRLRTVEETLQQEVVAAQQQQELFQRETVLKIQAEATIQAEAALAEEKKQLEAEKLKNATVQEEAKTLLAQREKDLLQKKEGLEKQLVSVQEKEASLIQEQQSLRNKEEALNLKIREFEERSAGSLKEAEGAAKREVDRLEAERVKAEAEAKAEMERKHAEEERIKKAKAEEAIALKKASDEATAAKIKIAEEAKVYAQAQATQAIQESSRITMTGGWNKASQAWGPAGGDFQRAVTAWCKAIVAHTEGNSALADQWTEVAQKAQAAAEYYKQSAQAYATGKESDGERLTKVASAINLSSTNLEETIPCWQQAQEEQSKGHQELANKHMGSVQKARATAEYHAQSALAYEAGNENEGKWLASAGAAMREARRASEGALNFLTHNEQYKREGNQELIDYNNQLIPVYQSATQYFTQSAQAYAAGNETLGEGLKTAGSYCNELHSFLNEERQVLSSKKAAQLAGVQKAVVYYENILLLLENAREARNKAATTASIGNLKAAECWHMAAQYIEGKVTVQMTIGQRYPKTGFLTIEEMKADGKLGDDAARSLSRLYPEAQQGAEKCIENAKILEKGNNAEAEKFLESYRCKEKKISFNTIASMGIDRYEKSKN